MGSMTQAEPKCLVRLGRRTLLERQIESLRGGGCGTIGIVTGYRSGLLEPYADRVFHNAVWETTNMVASLFCAEAWLSAGPVIVSYSDIFYSPQTVRRLIDGRGDAAISFDPDWHDLWSARAEDPLADAESFKCNADGTLAGIGQKVSRREEAEGQFMGLLRFTPSVWPEVKAAVAAQPPERQQRLDMTSLLALLIGRGVAIQAVPREGVWGECDTPSDAALYERWIAEGRLEP